MNEYYRIARHAQGEYKKAQEAIQRLKTLQNNLKEKPEKASGDHLNTSVKEAPELDEILEIFDNIELRTPNEERGMKYLPPGGPKIHDKPSRSGDIDWPEDY